MRPRLGSGILSSVDTRERSAEGYGGSAMGLLFRTLAPKPVKRARRLAHPVSIVTPRPVRNVKRMGAKAVNPVGAMGDALETGVVRAARGRGGRRRPKQITRAADDVNLLADFELGDPLPGWTPGVRPAFQVPILNSDPAFLILEENRLTASRELAYAVTEEARLEALLVINALYERQVSMLVDLATSGRMDPPIDADVAHCWSWTNAWMDASKQGWQQRVEEQNALVASMDQATAQEVADNKATPRLQAIIARAADAGP
jgi:hypothetical protein